MTKDGKILTEDQVRARIKVGAPGRVHDRPHGDYRTIARIEVDDHSTQ